MGVSILGERISIIKPAKPSKSVVYKSDRPYARYQARTITIKENCGTVVSICVEATDGYVYSLAKGIHADVIEAFDLEPDDILRVGWELDNGNFIWRE